MDPPRSWFDDFLYALSRYLCDESGVAASDAASVVYSTVQIVLPRGFSGAAAPYRHEPWLDSLCVDFDDGAPVGIRALASPILKAECGRELDRLSFRFNPERA